VTRHTDNKLRDAAFAALERSHAPYSGFPVGAALRAGNGVVFQGCNVENASYGLGICAERVAVFSAVMTGAGAFDCIAIATEAEEPSPPCGACLQVLAEFAAMDLKVYSYCRNGAHASWSLGSLLPHPFTANLLTTTNG
jgi:cytidine deaminase